MQVNVYTRVYGAIPTINDECHVVPNLSACFPGEANDDTFWEAYNNIKNLGFHLGGGGASQFYLITPATEEHCRWH